MADGGCGRTLSVSAGFMCVDARRDWWPAALAPTVVVMSGGLAVKARRVAQKLLLPLPRRWAHVQGVAARGAEIAALVEPADADLVTAACWLHDIGYAEQAAVTGFHPLDGARVAAELGFPWRVVSLVAFHTGAGREASVRGLSAELSVFAPPPERLLDLVTFADLTTSVGGAPIAAEARVAEILHRYRPGDAVHRAVSMSAPELLAAVGRVHARVEASGFPV